jgi:prepilin-type N-terminal cleavage/methylation domain-containing protein
MIRLRSKFCRRPTYRAPRPPQRPPRRGFTLLETMMAASILLLVVMAVSSAMTAAHQHAYEAQQRIAGSLAAEELMNRLMTVEYSALPSWHRYREPVGKMTDIAGEMLPEAFSGVGREVSVSTVMRLLPGVDVNVRGRNVTVRTFDHGDRTLTSICRFVPEPQS